MGNLNIDFDKVIESIPEGSYWRTVYEEAPSLAKEYYKINFALSPLELADDVDEDVLDQLEDMQENMYEKLDDESWKYIISKTSGPSKLGLGQIWNEIKAERAAASQY